ncbi:MAG: hypothetical protein ABSH48_07400 [Verrucomicrobiota bacterium]|jgi:hypothetical protein
MDAPQRGAMTLVRLIGVLCIVVTILELGLYWASCSIPGRRVPVRLIPLLVRLVPSLIGFVVLLRARAIADWISDILDL